ncbi:MAG TPA: glycine betaine ABC transporter substrate-binding protein, partial [Woeseiaceae bacterium]|nr:glycine betaine ABC transporter substrate-binding protein [Woeseiaceae bacterium]
MRGVILALLFGGTLAAGGAAAEAVVIGSKNFTENYILAEAAAQLLESKGIEVERRLGLNGTRISFEALVNGAIDVYPEYSGTISEVILGDPGLREWQDVAAAIAERHLVLLEPLGFDNTYAIAVTGELAREHQLREISD